MNGYKNFIQKFLSVYSKVNKHIIFLTITILIGAVSIYSTSIFFNVAIGQTKSEEASLGKYSNALVAEIIMLQGDLPWGKSYNALARAINTPVEQVDPVSFLTSKMLPPLRYPIQESFKIINEKLQGAAIIILTPSSEQRYQRKLLEITKRKLDSKLGIPSKKLMDTPEILGYAWFTKEFLVAISLGKTDDPAVSKGEISPFAFSVEIIHRVYAASTVAEFEQRMNDGTFESQRIETLDKTGFPSQDANQLIQKIKYGDSRTKVQKDFVHFDVTVNNEMGIVAYGFRHLDLPAAVEVWFQKGVVAMKGIHLLYALTNEKPQTVLQNAVKKNSEIYGKPFSKSDQTAFWLYDRVLVTVVHNTRQKMVTIAFAHRDFDPKTNEFLRNIGR